jgi:putative FmdB family regulatory protein
MPIYEYQCECGFQAEKLWSSASESSDTIPCLECGKEMKKVPSVVNHTFKHGAGQTRGVLPPNTGTSDDWNVDKAIGRDAAEKWETIEKRNALKDGVIKEERKAGRLVKRDHLVPKGDGSGEYRVITEPERVRANENRQTAFQIAQAAKALKAEKTES